MTIPGEQLIVQSPPPPWKALDVWAVGGLFQVGYAEGTDLLLVLSSQGRGVFDCLTSRKVARVYDEAHDYFDPIRLVADGFGPLDGQKIRMAGLFGGGLPRTTEDHWGLEEVAPDWPNRTILLASPMVIRDDGPNIHGEHIPVGDDGACELRAYGFSETGRSFIIATSCDLAIFAR